MITLNLTVHFYTSLWSEEYLLLLSLLGLNLAFVLIAEWIQHRWQLAHRILPRMANLMLILALLSPLWTISYFSLFEEYLHFNTLFFLIGFVVYRKVLPDQIINALYFFPSVLFIDVFWVQTFQIEGIFFALIFSIGALIYFIKTTIDALKAQYKIQANWLMSLPIAAMILLIVLLIIFAVFLTSGNQYTFTLFALTGLVIGVVGLGQQSASQAENLTANIALAIGQVLGCLAVYWHDFSTEWLLVAALVFHVAIYVLNSMLWLRVFSWCVLFQALHIVQLTSYSSVFISLLGWISWIAQVAGTAIIFAKLNPEKASTQRYWLPFAWASVLFWLTRNLPVDLPYIGIYQEWNNIPVENFAWQDFFQQMFIDTFAMPWWSQAITLLFAILPLLSLWSFVKSPRALLIGGLLSLWLLPMGHFTFAVTLLIIAVYRKERTLLALASLLAGLMMWNFYYGAGLPFLYKSFYMGVLAAISLLGYLLLHTSTLQNTEENRPLVRKPWGKMTFLGVFSVGLLLSVQQKMQRYESVLAQGSPIILALAPVDPRSLMQGDYMSLNYQLITDIRTNAEFKAMQEKGIHHPLYALMNTQEDGTASLAAIVEKTPKDQPYINIRVYQDNVLLPSQEFFFPEGKAKHYEQARYAEYRFKDGVALLARLLDKDLNSL